MGECKNPSCSDGGGTYIACLQQTTPKALNIVAQGKQFASSMSICATLGEWSKVNGSPERAKQKVEQSTQRFLFRPFRAWVGFGMGTQGDGKARTNSP